MARQGTSAARIFSLDGPPIAAIYAIGDVHGCLNELQRLERRIIEDRRSSPGLRLLVFLGDYIDRGPDSAGVLHHLQQPLPFGFARLCLRGNHEAMMLGFLNDPMHNLAWLNNGGVETMRSYGVDARQLLRRTKNSEELRTALRDAVPPEDIQFLTHLPVAAKRGRIVFVHAGIRPGRPLSEQTEQDLMWIREPFISTGPKLPLLIVHGHTPYRTPVRLNGRIGIDTGAYRTGALTALRIVGNSGSFLSTTP